MSANHPLHPETRPAFRPQPSCGAGSARWRAGALALFGLLAHICCLPAGLAAGAADYVEQSWQSEDGLPQNSIQTMLQTRDGYLWLGTFNGLVRFDGLQFTLFTLANTPDLKSDSINTLVEDARGTLWIGTEGGGVCAYSRGRFESVTNTSGAAVRVVRQLCLDRAGQVWVGAHEGLFRVVGAALEAVAPPPGRQAWGEVERLTADRQSRLHVLTQDSQVLVLERGVVVETRSFIQADTLTGGETGEVWLVANGMLRDLADPAGREMAVPSDAGYWATVCSTPAGDVWLASSTGGLRRRRGAKWEKVPLDGGHAAEAVLCLLPDREGNLWVGTDGAGLHRLRPKRLGTHTAADGLPSENVATLLQDRLGRVWVGTFRGGLAVWQGARFQAVPGLPGPGNDVVALCESRDGGLWVGTYQGELWHCKDGAAAKEDLSARRGARVVYEDREGGLWIGSARAGVEHRQHGVSRRYSTAEGLSHDCVTALVQDREGAIWAGTKDGLNRIRQGTITTFRGRDGLGVNCIHTLYVDRGGVLWVGTAGGGLARQSQGRFKSLDHRHGLVNDVVAQIVEDDQGDLWLGTNAGLTKLRRAHLEAWFGGSNDAVPGLVLNRNDGMPTSECPGSFQPPCLRARDGRLWFANLGGVVVVDPRAFGTNGGAPPPYVEWVAHEGQAPALLRHDLGSPASHRLPAGVRQVQIGYTAPSLIAPEKVRFRYRLGGFEEEWVQAGARRIAYYPRLPPGEYRFEVTAHAGDGVWNLAGAGLNLMVAPFWWETAWCRGLALAALLGLSAALVRWQAGRRLRRALERAERVHAENRAAELGAANERLQSRTRELEDALARVKVLSGLIPICASCKRIRDDRGFWNQVERYVQDHSDARFTHGLCPACIEKFCGSGGDGDQAGPEGRSRPPEP